MNEVSQKPGQSVREMLSVRSPVKALSNLHGRERSPEETAKLMDVRPKAA
jgi:hypothetical protein